MATRSSTTYLQVDLVDGDILATIAAAKATAAERLGGEDGLVCIAANLADAGHVAMTWRREWEEADAPVAEPAKAADEKPIPSPLAGRRVRGG